MALHQESIFNQRSLSMQRPAFFFLCILFSLLMAGAPLHAQESVRLAPPILHAPENLKFLGDGITALLTTQMENADLLEKDPEAAGYEIRSVLTAFGGTMVTDLTLMDLDTGKAVLSRRHSTREESEILPEITAFGDAVLTFLQKKGPVAETAPPVPSAIVFQTKEASPLPGAPITFQIQGISAPRQGALVSMDNGDLTGDGAMEIVLADRNTLRLHTADLQRELAAFSLPHYEHILRVDVLDTNGDGKAEIWLTAINSNTQRMRSRVLVFAQGEIREATGIENRFFAKGRNEDGRSILLTRMRGFRNTLFSGNITEARLSGNAIRLHESRHPQDALFDAIPVRVRDLQTQDRLHIGDKGMLSLVSPSGETVWESRDAYAGSPVFIDYVLEQKDGPPERFYFPGRTRILSQEGEPEKLLAIRNVEAAGRLFERMRMFRSGSLHLLSWNGYSLEIAGFTQDFDGYIADFIYIPSEKNSPAKVLFALVKGGGNLSLAPETRFVTCSLSP